MIDEANHFEQAVRGAFAIEIASREMADAIAYLESVLRRLDADAWKFRCKGIAAALTAMIEFREETAGFASALAAVRGAAARGKRWFFRRNTRRFRDGRLKIHLGVLRKRLKEIAADLSFVRDPEACRKLGIRTRTVDRLKTALRDLQENAETLKTIGEKVLSPGHVTAGVLFVRHWTISVRAVEVADILRDHLYAGRDCVIFTSATLRQGESFDGFRRAAGMGGNGDTMRHRVPIPSQIRRAEKRRRRRSNLRTGNSVFRPSPRPLTPPPRRSPSRRMP